MSLGKRIKSTRVEKVIKQYQLAEAIFELSQQARNLISDFRLLRKTDQASVIKITGALKNQTKVGKNA